MGTQILPHALNALYAAQTPESLTKNALRSTFTGERPANERAERAERCALHRLRV